MIKLYFWPLFLVFNLVVAAEAYGEGFCRSYLERFFHPINEQAPPSIVQAARTHIERAAKTMKLDPRILKRIIEPERVVEVSWEVELDSGEMKTFHGFRCLHSSARGPGKGGFRLIVAEDADIQRVLEESRSQAIGLGTLMTIKDGVSGIPLGGAKGDIILYRPKKAYSQGELARIVRGNVRALVQKNAVGPFEDIPAPDMDTGAPEMKWFLEEFLKISVTHKLLRDREILARLSTIDPQTSVSEKTPYIDQLMKMLSEDGDAHFHVMEVGVVTGKPVESGGSLGREKATGFGGFLAYQSFLRHFPKILGVSKAMKAKALFGRHPSSVTVAVEGSGNVGEHNARSFHEAGYRVHMINDVTATLVNQAGIDIREMYRALGRLPDGRARPFGVAVQDSVFQAFLAKTGTEFIPGTSDRILSDYSDIKVLAARHNVITAKNARDVNGLLVIELANDPITPAAARILEQRGVLVLPDVYANIGGVTVSYYEWLQNIENLFWLEKTVDTFLAGRMDESFEKIAIIAKLFKTDLRNAAYILALARVAEAEMARGMDGLRSPYKKRERLGLVPDTVEGLAKEIEKDESLSRVIRESERRHEAELRSLVDQIKQRILKGQRGIVLISGPRTSGKMMLSKRLYSLLEADGRAVKQTDFDLDPTIDAPEDVRDWVEGWIESGDGLGCTYEGYDRIGSDDIVIAEGDYALQDEVIALLRDRHFPYFGIAVNPATSMKLKNGLPLTSRDLRLLSEILTRAKYQSQDAAQTLRRFLITRNEAHSRVYPSLQNADVYFNSYLPYVLALIKPQVLPLLEDGMDSAKTGSEVLEMQRLLKLLEGVPSLWDTSSVPEQSIARQFMD